MQQQGDTARRLIAATEAVIRRAQDAREVTVRAIAAEAGARASAIGYHFGGLEDLVAATARQVYHRLNTERMNALQAAVDAAAPHPPQVRGVIAALIGPSVRWSLDRTSAYRVFDYVARMTVLSPRPELYRVMSEEVAPHRAFVAVLRRAAPWLSEAEIGWRINAALGIRSQVNRQRLRSALLTKGEFDLDDPEAVIAHMLDVIEPMFARPDPAPPPRYARRGNGAGTRGRTLS
jgi:AcrR family transcriptional regulator